METILNRLLVDLEKKFHESDIKKYCLDNNFSWFYSLIITTLESGGPLVLGFNWGASNNERYQPQTTIEKSNFEIEDVGSLSRIYPYCKQYFGDDFLSKTNQSNYCFFRSKEESQISKKDIGLCEPIFDELVDTVKPSSILCFSSKLRDYLFQNKKITSFEESKIIMCRRGSTDIFYTAIRAILTSGVEIKFLPHPNCPMKSEARSSAWEFCCGSG